MRSSALVRSVGWLPALWWPVFCVSTTMLPAPPAFGPITAVNVFYLAMLPAAGMAFLSWRRPAIPGLWFYAALFAWVAVGVLWHDRASGVDVFQRLLIYALSGLAAAQLVVGTRRGAQVFAVSLMLTAGFLSLWTVGYAMQSGFAYRSGVPINPNWPATLIGPGLLAATALYGTRPAGLLRRMLAVLILLAWYSSLLLGSRGVLVAVFAGLVVWWWHARPAVRTMAGLAVGLAIVTVMAQMPAIPYAGWRAARWMAGSPVAPVSAGLDPSAARNTAFGRFSRREATSFNFRMGVWRYSVRYQVSGVRPLLLGGGMGRSQLLAAEALPVFGSAHNTYIQMWVDFGLLGLLLFGAWQWRIVRALLRCAHWTSSASLAWLAFWSVAGMTATVTDAHVFWLCLGVAAARPVVSDGPDDSP